jgi:hypothetical protein
LLKHSLYFSSQEQNLLKQLPYLPNPSQINQKSNFDDSFLIRACANEYFCSMLFKLANQTPVKPGLEARSLTRRVDRTASQLTQLSVQGGGLGCAHLNRSHTLFMKVVGLCRCLKSFKRTHNEAKPMSTEFNELLQNPNANQPQIWVVGSREQVNHIINEFYVKRVITDRNQFSPMIPAPLAPGQYMTLLLR